MDMDGFFGGLMLATFLIVVAVAVEIIFVPGTLTLKDGCIVYNKEIYCKK